MKLVRLTNLGNLTLKNLVGLDKKYEENAGLKRKKLAQLWNSRRDMEMFENVFSRYAFPKSGALLLRYGEEGSSIDDSQIDRFRKMGLVDLINEGGDLFKVLDKLEEDYTTNPLQDTGRIVLELTGSCNLRCNHCYRGGSRKGEYGLSVDKIKSALEPMLRAGVYSITITGGEPTVRKKDLIEIIDYLSQFMELKGVSVEEKRLFRYGLPNPTIDNLLRTPQFVKMREELIAQLNLPKSEVHPGMWNICNENSMDDVEAILKNQAYWSLEYSKEPYYSNTDNIGVLSNGSFDDPRDLVQYFKSRGVHLQTSLDSFNGHRVNRNRGEIGLFGKLKRLIKISSDEEFRLHMVAHNLGGVESRREKENEKYFDRFVIGGFGGMLPIGNAAQNKFKLRDRGSRSYGFIGQLDSHKSAREGWCTGWTFPEDIHIKPTGVVGNCLYAYAVPEEFGNLHLSSMEDIVNNIQNSRVYQMFRDGSIERYQHELNKSLFPEKFSSSCEVVAITLTYGVVKEMLIQRGIEESVAKEKANDEVARIYKFK